MPVAQRLAVAPFENLSYSSELDWAGRAIAAGIVYDLTGAPNVYAQAVDSIQGAQSGGASRIVAGYLFQINGRLEIRVAIEDGSRAKTVGSFGLSGPVSEGVLPLVNQLARQLGPGARSFGTADSAAFRAYGEGLLAADPTAAARGFQSATAADPHFAEAYMDWAKVLLATGDRGQGATVLMAAKGSRPDGIDDAKIDYLLAAASGDPARRLTALEALTRRTPADPTKFKELAELHLAQRRFPDAVRNYEAAARLSPAESGNWNELGYARAFAQDLAGAREALEEYQRLTAPEDLNALDSLGEVSFHLGDFEAAGKYFLEADRRSPGALGGAELLKAAQARMMMGDLRGADEIFQKFQKHAGLAAYQQAQWEFLTGRRKAGMALLEKLSATTAGDVRAISLSQLSIWRLATGDSKDAADLAGRAEAGAVSTQVRNLGAMVQSIAAGNAANAYALLFARKYREAVPLLEAMYRGTNPLFDGQIRTLLAWAYVETGRIAEARALLRIYPIPLSPGEPLFASLIFPRYFYLRGAVLQDEGKRAEAKQSYELYLKYAGDVPEVFGDEEKVRKFVGLR